MTQFKHVLKSLSKFLKEFKIRQKRSVNKLDTRAFSFLSQLQNRTLAKSSGLKLLENVHLRTHAARSSTMCCVNWSLEEISPPEVGGDIYGDVFATMFVDIQLLWSFTCLFESSGPRASSQWGLSGCGQTISCNTSLTSTDPLYGLLVLFNCLITISRKYSMTETC